MKYTILFVFAAFLFTACETADQRYTQNSPEIETVKRGIQNYNAKNWNDLDSFYADTARVFYNTISNPFLYTEIPAYHAQSDSYLSSRGFVDEGQYYEMVLSDDGETWVNFWGLWKGTMSANNAELEIPVHLTSQFIDGKIVREFGYWDAAPIVLAIQEIEALE